MNKMEFEYSSNYIDRIKEAIHQEDALFIESSLEDVNTIAIIELLREFNSKEAKFILEVLSDDKVSKILVDMEDDERVALLSLYSDQEIALFVERLDSDDGTDILYDLDDERQNGTIRYIKNEEKANYLLELLRYDENMAGGLMAKEVVIVKGCWKVKECIEEIRNQAQKVKKIFAVYVVNNKDKLLGRVFLKKLLLAKEDAVIGDLTKEKPLCVHTTASKEEVIQKMQDYDLVALPVINARGKLVGLITMDDVIDVVIEDNEEDMQLMSGVSMDVEEEDSIWKIARARLPWLIIGMFGGIVGARFIGIYEEDIEMIPALAFFIPLITATGGNVGIQSSSIIVHGLANPSAFNKQDVISRLLKALLVSLLNGLVLAMILLIFLFVFGIELSLIFTISVALFSVVMVASFSGTVTPLVLHRLKINPALASGPFITTTNDLLGIGIYFLVAHFIHTL